MSSADDIEFMFFAIYPLWCYSQIFQKHDSALMLWCCWLGGRKGIPPVITEWWSAGVVICLERGADLHMAQLISLPLAVSCFSKIQIGFTFLVPAHPGCRGQRAVKRVCVCVCVCVYVFQKYDDKVRIVALSWQRVECAKMISEFPGVN